MAAFPPSRPPCIAAARDCDAIRDLLADEVRLDLVNRTRLKGRRDVANYFRNYSLVQDWQLAPGFVDGRPAIPVRNPSDPSGRPMYFVLLDWTGDRLVNIREFRYARYAIEGAEPVTLM